VRHSLFVLGGLMKVLVILSIFLSTVHAFAAIKLRPHLDLETTTAEYMKFMQSHRQLLSSNEPLAPILAMGPRNMQWLQYMNQFRDEANKIRFTKPGDLGGIPIDKPKLYSDVTSLNDYQTLLGEMPEAMKKILIDGEEFTQNPPIAIEDYIKLGKKADKIYQTAVRWKMMQQWLPFLEANRADDVRGYYFFGKMADVKGELESWSTLSDEKKAQYRDWLGQMCMNEKGIHGNCQRRVQQAEEKSALYPFYQAALPAAKNKWDEYFDIPKKAARKDIEWTAKNPGLASLSFKNPKNDRIMDFLRINIEDEFKTAIWNLKLNFVETNEDIPRLVFQAGVTPHVNELGGNIITMDANSSIEEWDVQWTIRHEFGHVLAFPDCYTEFYDPDRKLMVNYQLDITNLMCSRAGRLQDLHYNELKKVYFRE
jgi:hypothetical protein